ncbi:Hypothetical protein FKW44_016592 [Caligus rogercresseyi]|uniref:Uncharacterized protein n=1 Tax=Caligus rogercresseyi TaxID=217165 RepID=A0A7T8H1Z3_CALRO|nr:Hypothetical protein FKW44_016592 [Caligus rogercresseyi]
MNDAVNTFRLAEIAEAEMEAKMSVARLCIGSVIFQEAKESRLIQLTKSLTERKFSPKVMKYYVSSIIVSKQSSGKEKAIFQGLRNCFHVS